MEIEVYDKVRQAEDSLWFYLGRRAIIRRLIRKYVPLPARNYLDIGCGTGGTMKELQVYAAQSVGLDLNDKALIYSKEKGLPYLFQGDASRLSLPSNFFDLVTALDVLEHCRDASAMLAEIRRVLRPGGICCLTVPALMILWSNLDRVGRHFHRYTTSELGEKAEQGGFQVLKLSYANTWLFPAILIGRLTQRLYQSNETGVSSLDFAVPNHTINRLLTFIFMSESYWLTFADLPIGSSAIAILQKPSNQ